MKNPVKSHVLFLTLVDSKNVIKKNHKNIQDYW